jgi:hypothetical protein
MEPRGSARFCGKCEKVVHDLSALSERAARRLLASTSESLCVRYLHDTSGEIWFGGDPPGWVPQGRLVRAGRSLAAAAALVAGPTLIQACGGADGGADPSYVRDNYDRQKDGATSDTSVEPTPTGAEHSDTDAPPSPTDAEHDASAPPNPTNVEQGTGAGGAPAEGEESTAGAAGTAGLAGSEEP